MKGEGDKEQSRKGTKIEASPVFLLSLSESRKEPPDLGLESSLAPQTPDYLPGYQETPDSSYDCHCGCERFLHHQCFSK